MEPEIIIESNSIICDIQAFVEKSEKAYYFYLWINPASSNPKIVSCWVCNRVTAPESVDYDLMEKGEAPANPAEYVAHDMNGIELSEKLLRIVWFEEGDAAALLSGDDIIAVIPGFAGINNFPGYSIYAKGTGPFAWELRGAYEHFQKVITKSENLLASFEDNFWDEVQNYHMTVLEDFFGKHEKYYVIDGNKFPPKALLQGRKAGVIYGITAGVSLFPMPKVEMNYEEFYKDYRRMELGFACEEKHEELAYKMFSVVAGLSGFPWEELTFLGHGHTIPFSQVKGYEYIIFLNSRMLKGVEVPSYPKYKGEQINLLWMKLITKEEYEFVVENGIDAFLDKSKANSDFVFRFNLPLE